VTALTSAGHKRSGKRTGRRALAALGAAAMMLPLGVGTASAQEFVEPGNLCTIPAPPAQFADRNRIAEVHLEAVDCAFAQRIVFGREGNMYEPKSPMRRDQMASLIARALEAGGFTLPAPQASRYNDVPEGSTHDDRISQLTQIGVIEGKTDGGYDPEESVRRDQMASFMVRAANFAYMNEAGQKDELRGNTSPDYQFMFTDVLPTNPHRDAIAAADDLIGIVQGGAEGRPTTLYAPALAVPRDQMATFVIRLLDVTAIPESTQ
jgi:hypothetical protein